MSEILNNSLTSSELSDIQTPQGLCISQKVFIGNYAKASVYLWRGQCITSFVTASMWLYYFLVATPRQLKYFIEEGLVREHVTLT